VPRRLIPNLENCSLAELEVAAKAAPTQRSHNRLVGIEGDPRPRRRWAQRGAKIRVPYCGEHLRMNVTGMEAPLILFMFCGWADSP